MILCESLKDKIIIIAEYDSVVAKKLRIYLQDNGFNNIQVAKNGNQLYEILRFYYNDPDQVGLIIVNESLPQCQLLEMCVMLSSSHEMVAIPFIVYGEHKHFKYAQDSYFVKAKCLLHYMVAPISYANLLIVIGFQLNMKHERCLRYQQEERLVSELAERKIIDAKLKYLVAHDELTSLLNRKSFESHLRLILNRDQQLAHVGAILFIDIDRFSLINELESFEVGDSVLVAVTAIIRQLLTKDDLFARVGADELCLYLPNQTTEDVRLFAEKIRQIISEYRFTSGESGQNLTISIGVTNLNLDNGLLHYQGLIAQARLACDMAKELGGNQVCLYSEHDKKVIARQSEIYWVPLIRQALLQNKLFLVFQPIVDLSSGVTSHYEVLTRMRSTGHKIIHSAEFIAVAERVGLIHSIDLFVVERAIELLAELPSMTHISLAINLSADAFQGDALVVAIQEKLEQTWLDPKRITFKIAESAVLNNFEQACARIAEIRALGCQFALNDFGAGFCSFEYLKKIPVDYVEIDGKFIQNLTHDESTQVLVKSIVEIANMLGKKTIAERVEDPETIQKLKEIGVNMGQGYYFGRPQMNIKSKDSDFLTKAKQMNLNWLQ
ncbi:MAG: hypothetical protein methR_P0554 [Methyloprofundus sp.]|nr:MAG: hypothetical protein methR_P0554 [Methyloprofundus sp.]